MPAVAAIKAWVKSCRLNHATIYVPEVIDYELRRELIRAHKSSALARLDFNKQTLTYLPITTEAMLLAAELWAQSRNRGTPTGDPKKLDIDVILAAQALTLRIPESDLILATSNVGHLSQFAPAALWQDIIP